MTNIRVRCLESAEALRAQAAAWNDLWHRSAWDRSGPPLPTARAELIAQWLDCFAPQAKFAAWVVEIDGRWAAALPLIEKRVGGVLRVGALPWNPWSCAGDLLLDSSVDAGTVLAQLSAAAARRWPMIVVEAAPLDAERWRQFSAACRQAGRPAMQCDRFAVGTVQIAARFQYDWAAYRAAWSGNHRRHMNKAMSRAEKAGGVELDTRRPRSAAEAEAALREGFAIEHRSWKGREGTSVAANPKVYDFYLGQAALLAGRGELELVFLRHRGEAIAFEYGWIVDGVYYSPKVGYDEAYARLSPGQLLRYLLFEEMFRRRELRAIDFMGPLSNATQKWSSDRYRVGKIVVSTGSVSGSAWMWTYRRAAEVRAWLRRSGRSESGADWESDAPPCPATAP